MENELEVVNIRLVKEPSLYSEQTLGSPQAVVELMAKELSQYDREVFKSQKTLKKIQIMALQSKNRKLKDVKICPSHS